MNKFNVMEPKFRSHAIQRMLERNITKNEVLFVFCNPLGYARNGRTSHINNSQFSDRETTIVRGKTQKKIAIDVVYDQSTNEIVTVHPTI